MRKLLQELRGKRYDRAGRSDCVTSECDEPRFMLLLLLVISSRAVSSLQTEPQLPFPTNSLSSVKIDWAAEAVDCVTRKRYSSEWVNEQAREVVQGTRRRALTESSWHTPAVPEQRTVEADRTTAP